MSWQNLRIGHGYDVHRFSEEVLPDKPLLLAGVKISDQRSLVAHSDGDLVLHALCDAMLGAIGEGDIGRHFPDTDDKFRNIASKNLLEQVMLKAQTKGWHLINLDITVVAQTPRLSPHVKSMTENLAELVNLQLDCVNIKATTTEGMGFTGREEGLTCYAVVLMAKDV
ncbi:MAG: 2-C-methyl-D-erythritol 2,4-cyclodiphosphate synthase [Gammaproteobacteria bacterium]|jgi:2-C-methyl-D-erythritol 2,4-cyclodiphosphate synthase|nr:2-C-methyl-D-erythritol 2,4-cyclodiphosphate synthase [Gammaproteobacteria bacterium]MDP6098141.1 2-C-methyl-D-erythritol 2,4-cyclodiphosphate synthase [Gammaproteobacteria bacterium]|tara:strand:- start:438 stop:941 length:504 start_codon:yes stop_codon:yes gene_type:complete